MDTNAVLVRRIGEMYGVPEQIIASRSSAVDHGGASDELRRHDLVIQSDSFGPSELETARGAFSFIEKLGLSRGEMLFYQRSYQRLETLSPGLAPRPEILEPLPNGRFRIVTEFIHGLGVDLTIDFVVRLGTELANLALVTLGSPSHSSWLELGRWVEWVRHPSALGSLTPGDRAPRDATLMKTVESIGPRAEFLLSPLPIVWCHNDVQARHLAVSDGELSRIRLVDWGGWRPNYLGADLSFLIRGSDLYGSKNYLYQAARTSFVSRLAQCGLQPDTRRIDLACALFRLGQRMQWFFEDVGRISNDGVEESLACTMGVMEALDGIVEQPALSQGLSPRGEIRAPRRRPLVR
jgi:hypothetical protein